MSSAGFLVSLQAAAPLWELPGRDGEPAWLSRRRGEASRWVDEHGFPTTKHEDWRYTRLDDLFEIPFLPASRQPASRDVAGALLPGAAQRLGAGAGGPRLVFVNGSLVRALSRLDGLPGGSFVGGLAAAVHDPDRRLEVFWALPPGGYRHAFRALNDALAGDGAFIQLPPGVAVEHPIELVFVSVAGEQPVASSLRSLVLAGPASSATVVEVYVGAGPGASLTDALTQVVLGEGAAVAHYKVQDESAEAFHLSSLEVRPGRASRFSSCLLALGARLGRHEVHARLEAEEAAVQLDGLFLPEGTQHHDNPVLVDHAAPNCTSHQVYKGVIAGHASGVFNGHVVVRPGAVGTDAHQVNKNLLLSERAEAFTRPRLEIFADEVACTHGAAVGHIDEDALFYLRSRGIPEGPARALLVAGFTEELLTRFPAGPLQDYARQLVASRLGLKAGPLPEVSST